MITILTPTYNRAELLHNLFVSLQRQTLKDFVWIIIDDGSSDNTKTVVKGFEKEADFTITYKYKENGGKHRALNFAYQFITTELTFIVDSDDVLMADAVELIEKVAHQYVAEANLCGFSFLRSKPTGEYLSKRGVPKDGWKEDYVSCRINRNISGDMAEIWYTNCLREYPFPEFEGENFLGEDVVWIKLAEKYKLIFFNRIIYIAEYLEKGLTNNRRQHNINSPKGCMYRARVFLNAKTNLRTKIKATLQYYIYGRFAGVTIKELFDNAINKSMFLVFLLPAQIFYKAWAKKYQTRKRG